MSKTKISEFSQTASQNTDINSININEGCPPSTINNAIRELMKQIKDFQVGAQGDGLTVSTLAATTATLGSIVASSLGAITATSANISGALTTATANITTATITNVVSSNATITGGTITGITDLAVADGGTGRSTLTADNVLLGDGTNAVKFVAPGTSGNVLTSNGTTWASATPSAPSALSTASGSAPSYSARAWVNFDGTGTFSPNPSTSAIRASGNVSSINKVATGRYQVNFTTAMSDGNYCVSGTTSRAAGNTAAACLITADAELTTTSVGVQVTAGGSGLSDHSNNSVAIFR
jgi:hypothetical protein